MNLEVLEATPGRGDDQIGECRLRGSFSNKIRNIENNMLNNLN
jgi:hypothetical protein